MNGLASRYLPFIKGHQIFFGLNDSEIATVLSKSEQIAHKANDLLIKEGDNDKKCYLVIEGELEVFKIDTDQKQHSLAHLSKGDIAGGIVLLDDKTRSASVRCLSDCELLVFYQQELEKLIGEDKNYYRVFKNIAAHVCDKFRESNNLTIQTLREKIRLYQLQVSMSRAMVGIILSLCFLSFYNLIASQYIDPHKSTSYLSVPLMLFMTIFLVVVFRAVRLSLSAYGLTLKGGKRAFFGGLLYSIPICILIMVFKWFLINYTDAFRAQPLLPMYHGRFMGDYQGWLIDTMVYAAVWSPFQELLARSGLQAPLEHLLTDRFRVPMAILVSNIIFMTAHLFLSTFTALIVFFPGLFFGWLFYKYKSLIAPITAHIIVGVWGTNILGLI